MLCIGLGVWMLTVAWALWERRRRQASPRAAPQASYYDITYGLGSKVRTVRVPAANESDALRAAYRLHRIPGSQINSLVKV